MCLPSIKIDIEETPQYRYGPTEHNDKHDRWLEQEMNIDRIIKERMKKK